MKTIFTLAFSGMMAGTLLAQTSPGTPPAVPGTSVPAPVLSEKKPTPATTAKKKKSAASAAAAHKAATPARPLAPGLATVNATNVNIRGQAKLHSEVVVKVQPGDAVTVLEEIVLDKPAANEPARWARIALPAGTKVWVNALFIDATSKTVVPRKLNLRAGPGENFSIVGLIEQGEAVQEVATKGDWMQIEAPKGAYAFIASQFLKQELPAFAAVDPAPAVTIAPASAPVPVVVPEPAPVSEPVPVAPPVTETFTPAGFTPATPATVPAESEAIARARDAVRGRIAELESTDATEPRIVSHEGVVRSSWSIQAPSPFLLVNPRTGATINYLYTTSTNLDLRKYKGLRIVVTGEEGLDARWKNTPVLTIQRIQVLDK